MVKIYKENPNNTRYEQDLEVVANVNYNNDLDYLLDNSNYQNGSVGKHKGITKLRNYNESYAIIIGSQWQGDDNYGYLVSDTEALNEIIDSGNLELLQQKKFERLKKLYENNCGYNIGKVVISDLKEDEIINLLKYNNKLEEIIVKEIQKNIENCIENLVYSFDLYTRELDDKFIISVPMSEKEEVKQFIDGVKMAQKDNYTDILNFDFSLDDCINDERLLDKLCYIISQNINKELKKLKILKAHELDYYYEYLADEILSNGYFNNLILDNGQIKQ